MDAKTLNNICQAVLELIAEARDLSQNYNCLDYEYNKLRSLAINLNKKIKFTNDFINEANNYQEDK